jgi:hypothetical protein
MELQQGVGHGQAGGLNFLKAGIHKQEDGRDL